MARVRRDARVRRRRHARRRLPPARRARSPAHGPHRHDRPRGADGGRPLRRRPPAAALQLRGPEHPPLGAAAGPGRRVPAGGGRTAGAGLGRGRRRVRRASLRRARGARPPRLHGHARVRRLPACAHRLARASARGPPDVQGGAGRPRLPAGREHRRQRRRGVRRAQGAVAHPRAQRRRGGPRPGSQARAERRHGDGGRASRPRARPRGRRRVRRPPGVRLRPHAGPGVLLGAHRRGVCAGRRPAGRDRRTLRRAPGPVRLGHPRRGLRRRRRPRRGRAR